MAVAKAWADHAAAASDPLRRAALFGPAGVAASLRAECPAVDDSDTFRAVFGDGAQLMTAACRALDRAVREATKTGGTAVAALLEATEHCECLLLLSQLLDPAPGGGIQAAARFDACLHVAAVQNLPAALCTLHGAFLDQVEAAPAQADGHASSEAPELPSATTAAGQKTLNLLSVIVASTASRHHPLLIRDVFSHMRVVQLFRTFAVHLQAPTLAGPSVAALTEALIEQLFDHGGTMFTAPVLVACTKALTQGFEFNFAEASTADAAVCRLQVLAHLLSVLLSVVKRRPAPALPPQHLPPGTPPTLSPGQVVGVEAVQFGPIVTALLPLQGAMASHRRVAERCAGSFFAFAFVAAREVHADPQRPTGIRGLFGSVIGAGTAVGRKILQQDDRSGAPEAGPGRLVVHPAVLEAACGFTVCCTEPAARNVVGDRLLALVGDVDGAVMGGELRVQLLGTLLENLRGSDGALQVAIVCAVSRIAQHAGTPSPAHPPCRVAEHLRPLVGALSGGQEVSYDCACSVASFLTMVAVKRGCDETLAAALLQHNPAKPVLGIVHDLAGNGDDREVFRVPPTALGSPNTPMSPGRFGSPAASDASPAPGPANSDFATPDRRRTLPPATARHNATLLVLLQELWAALLALYDVTPTGDFVHAPSPTRDGPGLEVSLPAQATVLLHCIGNPNAGAAAARQMLCALIAVDPRAVGVILDEVARVTAAVPWPAVTTAMLLVAVDAVVVSPQAAAEFLRRNGVQLTLSLLQHLTSSTRPGPDLACLTALLSAVLPEIRFCPAVATTFRVSVPPELRRTVAAAQTLIDLATGQLTHPSTLHMRRWVAAAGEDMSLLRTGSEAIGPYFVRVAEGRPLFCPFEEPFALLCEWVRDAAVDPTVGEPAFIDAVPDLETVLRRIAPGFGGALRDPGVGTLALDGALPAALLPTAVSAAQLTATLELPAANAVPLLTALLRVPLEPVTSDPVHSVTLHGCGGIAGRVAAPGGWAVTGFTVAAWLRWEGDAGPPLWRLWWQGSATVARGRIVDLALDDAGAATLCVETVGGSSGRWRLGTIPARRWVHAALEFQRSPVNAAETYTLYVDGVASGSAEVQPGTAAARGGSTPDVGAAVDCDVRLGFPETTGGLSLQGAALSFSEVTVINAPCGPGGAARLCGGMPLDVRDRPPLSCQPQLGNPEVRMLRSCLRRERPPVVAGGVAKWAPAVGRWDDWAATDIVDAGDVVATLHPAAAATVDPPEPYLDAVRYALRNGGGPGLFTISGHHTTPPMAAAEVSHQVVALGGLPRLLAWLREAVAARECGRAAAVLRLLGTLCRRVDCPAVRDRGLWCAVAYVLQRGGAVMRDAAVVMEVVRLAIVPISGDALQSVLVNVPFVECGLLHWPALACRPLQSVLSVSGALRTLLTPSNPLRCLNAARLEQASFMTHMTYGVSRSPLDTVALLDATTLVEDFLLARDVPARAVSELLAFLCATVPLKGDTAAVGQRLGSAMPVVSYIATVREALLRALELATERAVSQALEDRPSPLLAALDAVCPPTAIVVLCDEHAGPVSAALTVRLLGRLLERCPSFRTAAATTSLAAALQVALAPHAHQADVLSGVARVALGARAAVPFDLMSWGGAGTPVEDFAPTPCGAPYVRPLFRMLQTVALATGADAASRGSTLRHAPVSIATHFASLSHAAATPPKRFRCVALAVLALVVLTPRPAASPPRGEAPLRPDAGADEVRVWRPAACPVTVAERDRRQLMVERLVGLAGELLRSPVLAGALYSPSAGPGDHVVNDVVAMLSCVAAMDDAVVGRAEGQSPLAEAQLTAAVLEPPLVLQVTREEGSVVADTDDDDARFPQSEWGALPRDGGLNLDAVAKTGTPGAAVAGPLLMQPVLRFLARYLEFAAKEMADTVAAAPGKTPLFVVLVHHLLHHAVPAGLGDTGTAWMQTHVLVAASNAVITALQDLPVGANANSDLVHGRLRLTVGFAQYILDRLVGGDPVPISSAMSFVSRAHHLVIRKASSNVDAPHHTQRLRQLMNDWAVFVVSPPYHRWSARRMADGVAALLSHSTVALVPAMPAEPLRRLTVRLVEVSLATLQDFEATVGAPGKALGELWFKYYALFKATPAMTQGLVDGNGGRRIDVLHSGFDLLGRQYDPVGSFLGYFADSRYDIAELFRRTSARAFTKFEAASAKRNAKWPSRQGLDPGVPLSVAAAEALLGDWARHCGGATVVDASLLSSRAAAAAFTDRVVSVTADSDAPVCWDPAAAQLARRRDGGFPPGTPLAALVTVCPGTVPPFLPRSAGGSVAATAASLVTTLGQAGPGSVGDVAGAAVRDAAASLAAAVFDTPAAAVASLTASLLPTPPHLQRLAGSSGLSPAALALIQRLVPHDATLRYCANVYVVLGGDCVIATLFMTATELLLLSTSQLIDGRDLAVAAAEPHDAASKKQTTKTRIANMFRRFLPGSGAGGSTHVAVDSAGGFRFSQYYRQVKADGARKEDPSPHVWRLPLSTVTACSDRSYHHQSAAVELTLESREAWLLVLLDRQLTMSRDERSAFRAALTAAAPTVAIRDTTVLRARAAHAQKQWVAGHLSTAAFLAAANAAASRTAADLTQYPVFPWALQQYTEPTLDVDDPAVYRDLSKPVGAQHPRRAEEIAMRYDEWVDDHTPPFHHGTHYSSSAVMFHFALRLAPFTGLAVRYQGGRLDVPERLFHGVQEAWAASSGPRGGDAKELLPEHYTLAAMLRNANGIALGTRRDGTALGDVVLPPWAKGSPERFVAVHRAALESDVVGRSLHRWLDLVFGVAQSGPEAVRALNVFHHVSYADGLMKAMVGAAEEEDRMAIVAQVDNFGLTPRQVFLAPHPPRAVAVVPAARPLSPPTVTDRPLQDAQVEELQKEVVGAPPAAATAVPLQQQFLARIPHMSARPAAAAVRHGRAVGATVVVREAGGQLLCSTPHHLYPALRPPQCFEWRPPSGIVVRDADDAVCTTVPGVAQYCDGDVAALACTASGNILCAAAPHGTLLVFCRHNRDTPFNLEHVLHCDGHTPRPTATTGDGPASARASPSAASDVGSPSAGAPVTAEGASSPVASPHRGSVAESLLSPGARKHSFLTSPLPAFERAKLRASSVLGGDEFEDVADSAGRDPAAVSLLRFFTNNTLVAAQGTHVTVWNVTVQHAALVYSVDVAALAAPALALATPGSGMPSPQPSFAGSPKADDVAAVSLDGTDEARSGHMLVATGRSLALLGRDGVLLAAAALRGGPPFTAATTVPFPTYSRSNVVVAGHADGSLTFWVLAVNLPTAEAADQAGPVLAFGLSFHCRVPRPESHAPAAVTVLVPTSEGFVAGCADGAVYTFHVPLAAEE